VITVGERARCARRPYERPELRGAIPRFRCAGIGEETRRGNKDEPNHKGPPVGVGAAQWEPMGRAEIVGNGPRQRRIGPDAGFHYSFAFSFLFSPFF
jgi:hypothetical protein